ncbi:hypothetical protein EC988_006504, partial [Linderina pennispora]
EAVRRIRISGVHSQIASDYFWAWLSRVEASAEVLTERLGQLEHHVSASLASSASLQGSADAQTGSQQQRPTPKAVSDVIQYQNDSFMAIAGKLAAVDEDVRRLKRKLGIKESE